MARYNEEVVKYIPHLRRYSRALMCNDVIAADDLVQDCLERALSRIHLWREGSDLRAWLFTIMHNLFVNHIRKQSRTPEFVDVELTPVIDNRLPEDKLVVRDLQLAISRLPPDQREVLLLVSIEGLRYQDVAGILGVPEGTVMSKLSRARQKVRNEMQIIKPGRLRRVK